MQNDDLQDIISYGNKCGYKTHTILTNISLFLQLRSYYLHSIEEEKRKILLLENEFVFFIKH